MLKIVDQTEVLDNLVFEPSFFSCSLEKLNCIFNPPLVVMGCGGHPERFSELVADHIALGNCVLHRCEAGLVELSIGHSEGLCCYCGG